MKFVTVVGITSLLFVATDGMAFDLNDAVNTLNSVNTVVDTVNKNHQEEVQQIKPQAPLPKQSRIVPKQESVEEIDTNRSDVKRVDLLQKEFYGAWSPNCKKATWTNDPFDDKAVLTIDKEGFHGHMNSLQPTNTKWIVEGKSLEITFVNCGEEGCGDVEKGTWILSNGNKTLSMTDSYGTTKLSRCNKK
jgi:hypothetical protein